MERTLLLVDDSPDIVALVEFALEDSGWRVVTADSVETALEQSLQTRPDLVLLDNQLNDREGLEVLEGLRADPERASLPVIVFSGSHELDGRYQQLGVLGKIGKPFDMAGLADDLARMAGWA